MGVPLFTQRVPLEVEITVTGAEEGEKPLFTASVAVFGVVVASASNTDKDAVVGAAKDAFVRKLKGS